MYLAIIILPLLGSTVSGFFGRKIGVTGSQIVTCSSVLLTTLLAILAFVEVGLNNIPVYVSLFRWVDSESLNVLWSFNFDSLTVSMLIPVLIVSSLVHIYSIGYMSHDPHNQRFFSYLSLFTFMMVILVTANNYLLMFVGWEGVGICSYLLVSFWFTRIAANQSSISAMLTNRVGDCLLTIGMFSILWSCGNIDYSTVFSLAPYLNENIITIIGICLLIGAMAKSSQVGLHVWLPMAMEGPTPVSALIHAATMVTAGVYLLMRSSPLIEYSSTVLLLCIWIGAITTVFSSLIGLFQQDIKKVIAYSTMSQLGMMVIAVGLSSYNIALFHLVNHAFYKALLFLGAGAVIHAVADNQDFRKYGGLKQFLPLTYSVMLIASLSLVAFPFMTGFYSKDFILESSYGQFLFSGTVVYFVAVIGAMFTTLYSIKVLYLTFITNPNGPIVSYKSAHEGNIFMSLPLIILAIFSVFFGYITKDMFIGLGSNLFSDNSIFIHPINEILLNTEFAVPVFYKLLPLLLTISLSILSIVISEYITSSLIKFKFSRIGYNIFSFFNLRFFIELFYNKYITNMVLKLGGQTTKLLDKGSIELIGPYGLEKALSTLSVNLSRLDTGVVTTYALYILMGLMFNIAIPHIFVSDNILLPLVIISIIININNNRVNSITQINKIESNVTHYITNIYKFLWDTPFKYKLAIFIVIYLFYILFIDTTVVYCMDDNTDKALKVAQEAAKYLDPKVNVSQVHVHNPNFSVPASVGTGVGLGGAVSAGIYALSKNKKLAAMPLSARAGYIALGGLIGGGTFVASNFANSYAQNRANSSNNKDGPFSNSVNSIIESSDSKDTVMFYLDFNLATSIMMLIFSIILLYIFIYKRNILNYLYITWALLIIINLISIYLSYNIFTDFGRITNVYQNTNYGYNYSIDIFNHMDNPIVFVFCILLFKLSIFGLLDILLVTYINITIINQNWEFTYIKNIFGERIHHYYMKMIRFGSKSNNLFIKIVLITIILTCILSILSELFLIYNIDGITEMLIHSLKSEGIIK